MITCIYHSMSPLDIPFSLKCTCSSSCQTELILPTDIPCFELDSESIVKCALTKLQMSVSLDERGRVELVTRKQASQSEWYSVRSKRITGSKCGKILIQKKKLYLFSVNVYTLNILLILPNLLPGGPF